jgi:hypothetical protein
LLDSGIEVNDVSASAQAVATFSIGDRAATGRQNHAVFLRKLVDDFYFPFAKSLFSFFFKYEGDIDTGARFDFFVAVDEFADFPAPIGPTRKILFTKLFPYKKSSVL